MAHVQIRVRVADDRGARPTCLAATAACVGSARRRTRP